MKKEKIKYLAEIYYGNFIVQTQWIDGKTIRFRNDEMTCKEFFEFLKGLGKDITKVEFVYKKL